MQLRESRGDKYVVAYNRSHPYDSVSQNIYLEKNKLYSLSGRHIFSSSSLSLLLFHIKHLSGFVSSSYLIMTGHCAAWIQVSGQNAAVSAVVRTREGFKHSGAIIAQPNCWSMLKGGLIVDTSRPAYLFFEVLSY